MSWENATNKGRLFSNYQSRVLQMSFHRDLFQTWILESDILYLVISETVSSLSGTEK